MSAKTDKIRVGMIRCDLRAIYYANLIQKHDPYILREPEYGLGGYFYFYTYYSEPKKIAIPEVSGFELTKLWDENPQLGNVLKCLEKDYGVRYPIGIKEVDKGKIP